MMSSIAVFEAATGVNVKSTYVIKLWFKNMKKKKIWK